MGSQPLWNTPRHPTNPTEHSSQNNHRMYTYLTYRSPAPRNKRPQNQGSPWLERHTNTSSSLHKPPTPTALHGRTLTHVQKQKKKRLANTTHKYYLHSHLAHHEPVSENTFTHKSHTDPSKHWKTTPCYMQDPQKSTLPKLPFPVKTESTWPGCAVDTTQLFWVIRKSWMSP